MSTKHFLVNKMLQSCIFQSTRGSESQMTTDNEMETDEELILPLIEEEMQKHKTAFEEMKMNLIHSGIDEQSAEEKAYSNVLPIYICSKRN